MNTLITTVAMGTWYPKAAARLVDSLSDQADVIVHHQAPEGTPRMDRLYMPYAAKPYALLEACRQPGVDVVILMDAAFWAVRSIQPLVDHIQRVGYYLCRNGFTIGETTSDLCLKYMDLTREQAMTMPDVSSYCVGVNTSDPGAMRMVERWCSLSAPPTICGPHTSTSRKNRRSRNPGFVSNDKRVIGHRHDQSVLSCVLHQLGLMEWVDRPRFTQYYSAYKRNPTEETCLVCEGMQ